MAAGFPALIIRIMLSLVMFAQHGAGIYMQTAIIIKQECPMKACTMSCNFNAIINAHAWSIYCRLTSCFSHEEIGRGY